VVVGDLMNSITLLVYKAAEGSLEVRLLALDTGFSSNTSASWYPDTVYIIASVPDVPTLRLLNLLCEDNAFGM
jgi:hypothetical protein